MTLTPLHFIIVCPLVFIAGFVDSIAGGGGLISLPAYLLAGLPAHTCVATNKMSSCMGTTIATARYARSGFIDWRLSLPCILAALAGASVGANIALLIPDSAFRIVMFIVLPLTALYVLTKKDLFEKDDRPPLPIRVQMLFCGVIALFIGMYDGFYGPGTGTFLLLLLTRFGRMDVQHANGTTKLINLTSNITSLTVFLLNAQVLVPLGLAAGCFSILGNYLGSKSFAGRGASIARPVVLVVLVTFFVRTALELLGFI